MKLTYKGLRFIKIFLFLMSAILAGYTVADLRPDILDIMTDIRAQFLINLVMTASFFDFTFKKPMKDIKEILFITVIFTGFLHLFRLYFVRKDLDNDKKDN